MITKIRHTGIVVRDLEKAVVFYGGLGFKTSTREVEEDSFIEQVVGLRNVSVETAKLSSPCGAMIELLQYHSHPQNIEISVQVSNRLGCSHIALEVVDIKVFLGLVKKLGGKTPHEPAVSSNQKFCVVYCFDMEGNIIELVEILK